MKENKTWAVLVHPPAAENEGAFEVPRFYSAQHVYPTVEQLLAKGLSDRISDAVRLGEVEAWYMAQELEDMGLRAWPVPLAQPAGDYEVWFIPAPPRQGLRLKTRDLASAVAALEAVSQYDLYLGKEGLASDWANAGGVTVQSEDPDDAPDERWDIDHEGDDLRAITELTGLGRLVTTVRTPSRR